MRVGRSGQQWEVAGSGRLWGRREGALARWMALRLTKGRAAWWL